MYTLLKLSVHKQSVWYFPEQAFESAVPRVHFVRVLPTTISGLWWNFDINKLLTAVLCHCFGYIYIYLLRGRTCSTEPGGTGAELPGVTVD